MEIICDTNIWYGIGRNDFPKKVLEDNEIIGTFHSIDELSRSKHLKKNPALVRNAIRALMTLNDKKIFEPPFAYLKKLDEPGFPYDVSKELETILFITQKIANGLEITNDLLQPYENYRKLRIASLKQGAIFFNQEAARIKSRIKNREKHLKFDSIPGNRIFISAMTARLTHSAELSESFDWSKIELFENVMKTVFNDLEIGALKLNPNDWFDFFNMIYVTPDRLYWTNDRKWLNLISKSGMGKYIYSPHI